MTRPASSPKVGNPLTSQPCRALIKAFSINVLPASSASGKFQYQSNAKKSNEQEKSMEQGIDAAKELNNFLEIPLGNNRDVYSMVQEAYDSKDFSGMDRMAKDFFGQKYNKWRLVISDESKNILYSYLAYEINTKEPAKSEMQVPVFDMGKMQFLTISLEAYK